MPWYTKILGKVVSKGSKAKPIVKTSKKLVGSVDDITRASSQGTKRINSVHGNGYANAGHVPHPIAGNVKPATTAHVPTTPRAVSGTAHTPAAPSTTGATASNGVKSQRKGSFYLPNSSSSHDRVKNFKLLEADNPTVVENLEADDIILGLRFRGTANEFSEMTPVHAPDPRTCASYSGVEDLFIDHGPEFVRSYDSESNVTAILYRSHDSGPGASAIYIPGKISQADAQEIYKMISKYYNPLSHAPIPEKFTVEQWKATKAEIAKFLNNGGKKAIKPAEKPASAHIIPEQPVVTERTSLGQPAITSTGTGHVSPVSTHIPTTPSSATGASSVVNTSRTEFTATGTAARTPNPIPALDKPFLNEREIKIIKDYVPNEKISNAVQAGFEELGTRLKNGEKMSETLLYNVARSVSAKTGVQDGTIMGFMKTNMHRFGGKWQILEWNQIGRMNEFWATR